jgi:hypothetical protein
MWAGVFVAAILCGLDARQWVVVVAAAVAWLWAPCTLRCVVVDDAEY